MRLIHLVKVLILLASISLLSFSVGAKPEYLKMFAADPASRPEWRQKCSTCHVDSEGGGERNAFGNAFAAAGFQITPELKRRFPDRFISEGAGSEGTGSEGTGQGERPEVTFVEGSDAEAIVVHNGKRYVINTRTRNVRELDVATSPETASQLASSQPATGEAKPQADRTVESDVYRPVDVRLINLPTAAPIPDRASQQCDRPDDRAARE